MQDLRHSELTYLPGIGPRRAALLQAELGISTWHDLLYTFPYKHIDRSRLYRVSELTADMPFVQLRGRIVGMEQSGQGRKARLVAHFTDGEGFVDLVWFQGIRYVASTLKQDRDYIVFGRPNAFNGRINIAHPDVDPAEDLSLSRMRMQPYYSTTEKMRRSGLASRSLEQFTSKLLDLLKEPVPETLPDVMRRQLGLMPLDEALRAAHYPQSAEQLARAMARLKFDELFFIQLSIQLYARQRQASRVGHTFTHVGPLFNEFYSQCLPFALTDAQKRVIREIHADMKRGRQMNRLLQGDVGSGKTLVALMVMLLAVDNGHQACIMAPTEILAEQHLKSFRSMLGHLPVRVELLTGTVKGKKRKEILEGLADGSVHMLVGTHAVIEDSVQFRSLGLAVIDEQHRFGVAQRARLWAKNAIVPHILVMTATPIPRTLAMTLYGDLDVSVIDQLPPGRKPIRTLHIPDSDLGHLYQAVSTQIEAGSQAYFVFPLVKESDKMALRNVENEYEILQKVFPDYRIGMVHGRMKAAEKEEQMRLFTQGDTQILVATTVIEVGVNVPRATVMVIFNAERFGLSQLHQLRGRVGRGGDQSWCILVTGNTAGADVRRRMQVMTDTTDGFQIAEEDLKLRGPGDLEGTQQSGDGLHLRLANLAKDGILVQWARDAATQVLSADPSLASPMGQMLRRQLDQEFPDRQGWGKIS